MDEKNSFTQTIRESSSKIYALCKEGIPRSLRQLAEASGCSKSGAQRHIKAIEQRNQYPESLFWESVAGLAWLRLMVFASLFNFGIRGGIGAESLSVFFYMIRIDTHVGVSPSAIRELLRQMEPLLPEFQRECEEALPKEPRKVTVAMDETFFGQFLILVMMDLHSGYLVLEDIADNRSYDTWYEKMAPRLQSLGIVVTHAISDRAKALIKLAITGLECPSGADLFHAQQDISRYLGPTLSRRLRVAEKVCEQEKTATETADDAQQSEADPIKTEAQADLDTLRQADRAYHDNLQGVSDDLHPFSIKNSAIQTADEIEGSLETRAKVFETLGEEQAITDRKGAIRKFRNQLPALAVSITVWWTWVTDVLQELTLDEAWLQWFTGALLPVIYWHRRMQQTHNPKKRERYKKAWHYAMKVLESHPLTQAQSLSDIQQGQMLAENMVGQFHRSSSAVEGRNGCLSQMYHNGRGFTEQRLRALTVVHNFFIKREDGTTAAQRLFKHKHPDLFEWLINQMGALPLPRKRRELVVANPLILLNVPR